MLAMELIFISSVFFLLILSPVPADTVSRRVVLSCIWLWLWARSARSSAKSRLSNCFHSVHCIPLFLPVVVVFMIQSMTRRKRNGDSRAPLTDSGLHFKAFGQLASVGDLAAQARDEGDDLVRNSVVPQQLHSISLSTLSKAFSGSTKLM